MNTTETLQEEYIESFSNVKENANNVKYDVRHTLDKQMKKDERVREKAENRAKEMRSKAGIMWNKMEARRKHID